MDVLLRDDRYHIPRVCTKCGGVMVFRGVGEYTCEDCGELAYDDYGKVRCYIEQHKGATALEIEAQIGVSQQTTRMLLKEGRIEVAADSKIFLRCEICGQNIRSGRFCPECEKKAHLALEEQQRLFNRDHKKMQGVGMGQTGDEGQRRFMRKDDKY